MNQKGQIPKLTTREKILIGASFVTGVMIASYVCHQRAQTDKTRIMNRVNDDLRQIFENGDVVGTGENANKILQYCR